MLLNPIPANSRLDPSLPPVQAYPVFDLNADLRSEFTWNTKQLFVYLNLEFETPKQPVNTMVVWNSIIQRPQSALISQTKLRTAYPFSVTDREASLRGTDFNVTVAWNVMPRVGRLYTRSQTFTGFRFPDDYLPFHKGNIRSGIKGNAADAA